MLSNLISHKKNNIFGILNLIIMNIKKFTTIALIGTAVIFISIFCGFAVFNNNDSSIFAYEIGRSAGKMANPYLFGLGTIALLLILIRVFAKTVKSNL